MEIYGVTPGIHRILRQKVRLLTSLMCSIFLHLGSRPTPCSPISSVPGRTPRWCKNWTITCIIHQWHVLPKCLGISKFKNNIYVWFLCLTLEKNLEIDSQHRKMFNGFFLDAQKKSTIETIHAFGVNPSPAAVPLEHPCSGPPAPRTRCQSVDVFHPTHMKNWKPPQHGLLHLVQSWIASPGKEIAVVTKASPIFCLCLWQVADILGKFFDEVPLFSSHPCRKWRNECVAPAFILCLEGIGSTEVWLQCLIIHWIRHFQIHCWFKVDLGPLSDISWPTVQTFVYPARKPNYELKIQLASQATQYVNHEILHHAVFTKSWSPSLTAKLCNFLMKLHMVKWRLPHGNKP